MANELKGAAQLTAKFKALGAVAAAKNLRPIIRKALSPARKAAKAAAPAYSGTRALRTYRGRLVAPGFLGRNIVISARVSKDKSTVSASLGVRKEAFYGVQFVERKRGKSSATGFAWLVPAFSSTIGRAQSIIVVEMQKRINKIAAAGNGP